MLARSPSPSAELAPVPPKRNSKKKRKASAGPKKSRSSSQLEGVRPRTSKDGSRSSLPEIKLDSTLKAKPSPQPRRSAESDSLPAYGRSK